MAEKISGIYRIVCVKNGRYYYGSSKHIHNRWTVHKRQLRKGTHLNQIMQRSWDKHGERLFRFELIERTSENRLLEVENTYLTEHFGKSNCMNIVAKACGTTRSKKLSNRPIQSEKMKEVWKHRSIEERAAIGRKMSQSLKGNQNKSGKKHARRGVPIPLAVIKKISLAQRQYDRPPDEVMVNMTRQEFNEKYPNIDGSAFCRWKRLACRLLER